MAGEPQVNKGWVKVGGKWRPEDQPEDEGVPLGDLAGLDDSLDASHKRMRFALAVQSRRLELAAQQGLLTPLQISALGEIANTWRVLVTHEPPPDLADLTDDELQAKLAAVKARGK